MFFWEFLQKLPIWIVSFTFYIRPHVEHFANGQLAIPDMDRTAILFQAGLS